MFTSPPRATAGSLCNWRAPSDRTRISRPIAPIANWCGGRHRRIVPTILGSPERVKLVAADNGRAIGVNRPLGHSKRQATPALEYARNQIRFQNGAFE